MSVFKKITAGVVMAGIMLPTAVFAETASTTSSIQTLLEQIKALQVQISSLKLQQQTIVQQQVQVHQQQQQVFATLVSTLKEGSAGDQVTVLQTILALDPSIYPEGKITGYFGRLTAEAVKRFQKKNGFEQVGNVGPKTLKRLNELFNEVNKGKGNDHKSTNDDNDDRKGSNPNETRPGSGKVTICHKPGKVNETLYVGASALFAHVKHGDTLGACAGGNATTTPPVADTIAPTLSSIVATNVSQTGATITWTSNENATTQVEYGTTASYGSTTTLNASLVASHSAVISGLSNGTIYHFRVISKDAAGNTATSGDMTFTTGTSDNTAPTLSSVAAGNLSMTGATITWTTNENATSQVEYGATTSYGNTTTLDTALVTGHSVNLSSLTQGTTYHFRVISKDSANNVATSGDMTFTTASDTTAPVISGVSVGSIASTSATVNWTTNEAATSKVYYGTSLSLDLATALNVSNATLVTGHTTGLTGLTASTTYYYVIESKDLLNNAATTSAASFVTIN
jgi:peptidoglycan hydrolase-like protein with peptidoglycan-binding domain